MNTPESRKDSGVLFISINVGGNNMKQLLKKVMSMVLVTIFTFNLTGCKFR